MRFLITGDNFYESKEGMHVGVINSVSTTIFIEGDNSDVDKVRNYIISFINKENKAVSIVHEYLEDEQRFYIICWNNSIKDIKQHNKKIKFMNSFETLTLVNMGGYIKC